MDKYIISWISFFDNELHIEVVDCRSIEHAMHVAVGRLTMLQPEQVANIIRCYREINEHDDPLEGIRAAVFDLDGMVQAIPYNT